MPRRWAKAIFPLAILLGPSSLCFAQAQPPRNDPRTAAGAIVFDIPAQRLEIALLAYGRIANVQVLYDAALAAHSRSSPVSGRHTARQALDILLRGTGLRQRYAGPRAVTLSRIATDDTEPTMVLDVMRVTAAPAPPDNRRFEIYAQTLQQAIVAALRRDSRSGHGDFNAALRLWIAPDGTIDRSSILVGSGDAAQDRAILASVQGLRTGRQPPPDMPQPVSFRIRAQRVR